jgi:threonine dehydrogenase-like Zn-dependent dehydrogenase
MRAIVINDTGAIKFDPSHPAPVPNSSYALIRPTLAGVCNTDLELAKGYMGYKGVLGHEFTGIVEQAEDSELIGKRVVSEINFACGHCTMCDRGLHRHCQNRTVLGILGASGAFADYLIAPSQNLHIVPDSVSDRQAVFTEPLAAALEIMEQIDINPDQQVAVMGDGKLGLLIAQALATTGCDLTAIGRHENRLSILSGRGLKTAFDSELKGENSIFDVVIDATGSPTGLATALDLVRPCGTIVLKTTVSNPGELDINRIVIDEIQVLGSRCGPFDKALLALEGGGIDVEPMITDVLPLERGVEALKLAEDNTRLKILLEI